jgi:hypothetical protein
VEEFAARMNLREALELYLFLEGREAELSGSPAKLLADLRAFLYDRLSIAEMESPAELLGRLIQEAR